MTHPDPFLRRYWRRLAQGVRDSWLMVGATIALLLVSDGAFRLIRIATRSAPVAAAHAAPPNPFDTTRWAIDYRKGHALEEEVRWAPYVYLRNPNFQSAVVSTDSLGHRITPQSASAASNPIRMFFLGGSTTFGWYQRNEHTLPSEVTRRLQALIGSTGRIEATNFGVPGRIFTQEILDLILQLRSGARPDIVMFYDGINDVMATVQDGQAGIPQNEANRVDDFDRGRRVVADNLPGIANDLRTTARAVGSVLGRLQFVRTIRDRKRVLPPVPAPTDSASQSIVRMYTGNARVVEALAAAYGFQVIYVWQPTLLSSTKPLTAREKWLIAPAERDSSLRRIRDVQRAVPPLIDQAMPPVAGTRFIDATKLFSDDSLEVYVDFFGHTYERANLRLVDSLLPALTQALSRATSRARRATAPASGALRR